MKPEKNVVTLWLQWREEEAQIASFFFFFFFFKLNRPVFQIYSKLPSLTEWLLASSLPRFLTHSSVSYKADRRRTKLMIIPL